MEFGRVTNEELNFVDFTLPPDPDFTVETLRSAGTTGAFTGACRLRQMGT
jgi:hypothetical protein